MKVAAIIVNYNDEKDTIKFVEKINKYEVINRIIVVDNMSTTIGAFENLKKLESEKVSVIRSERNGGYSYGNNLGISFLKENKEEYDYIIISNPDVIIEENAIIKCLEVLQKESDAAVVAPRMFNKQNNPIRRSSWKIRTFKLDVVHSTRLLELIFYKKLRNGEYSEKEYMQPLLEVDAISGAFFIIKYDVYKKINKFDENTFLFYEEDMLAKKLKELELKTYSVNTEKFIHLESQAIGKAFSYYKKMKQLYKAKMYYHKNYNKINGLQIFIFGILNFIRKLELLIEIPIRKILNK